MNGVLDLGIDLNVWPWIWLFTAVVFALIELTILGGTFVLLPFAVSAFFACLAGFYDAPIEVQWLIFVVGGGLLFALAYRWVRRYLSTTEKPLGVGADRLVGMTGTVTDDVSAADTDRKGKVSVSGEIWNALTDLDRSIAVGTRVRIVAMRGTRVVVEPVLAPPAPSGGTS
ncbi:MAG: NfeD family protein [Ilumatobacteraceae bacterium]